jgi:hypothetical protein
LPAGPPAAAVADRRIAVALAGADRAHVDAVAAAGWLGDDRPAVLRAMLLRHVETLRAAGR